jgi:DNA-binding LytR/AlgR family response regulator
VRGRFEVDLSLAALENAIDGSLLRVHRSWLVNADCVKELEGSGSETELLVGPPGDEQSGLHVPVARERVYAVREALLNSATGVRQR